MRGAGRGRATIKSPRRAHPSRPAPAACRRCPADPPTPMRAEFDLPAIQSLFSSIDFVGISAYIPMPSPQFEVGRAGGRAGAHHPGAWRGVVAARAPPLLTAHLCSRPPTAVPALPQPLHTSSLCLPSHAHAHAALRPRSPHFRPGCRVPGLWPVAEAAPGPGWVVGGWVGAWAGAWVGGWVGARCARRVPARQRAHTHTRSPLPLQARACTGSSLGWGAVPRPPGTPRLPLRSRQPTRPSLVGGRVHARGGGVLRWRGRWCACLCAARGVWRDVAPALPTPPHTPELASQAWLGPTRASTTLQTCATPLPPPPSATMSATFTPRPRRCGGRAGQSTVLAHALHPPASPAACPPHPTAHPDPHPPWPIHPPTPSRGGARQYLRQGGCTYRVDALDIWSLGSWDVLAIYPLSSTGERARASALPPSPPA